MKMDSRQQEYQRCYHAEHRQEAKEYQRRYRVEHRQQLIEHSRRYRTEHHQEIKEQQHCYRAKQRQKIFDHYGWKCVCCGESRNEFLTIDHINNDGARHRKEVKT